MSEKIEALTPKEAVMAMLNGETLYTENEMPVLWENGSFRYSKTALHFTDFFERLHRSIPEKRLMTEKQKASVKKAVEHIDKAMRILHDVVCAGDGIYEKCCTINDDYCPWQELNDAILHFAKIQNEEE